MKENSHPYPLELLQEGMMLLFDKPLGWTSFDVVNRIRVAICRYYGIKKIKIGHAGTLDPLATGLLVICTGKWTRRIENVQNDLKKYTGIIKLGQTTASYDLESSPEGNYPIDHINTELIAEVKDNFIGSIMQIPPAFSAIKKEGKRSYDLARAGKEVTLDPREIIIYELELNWDLHTEIEFSVICSKGTYIRSLAHDIGIALHSGAYLASLRRVAIGDLLVSDAITIDHFLSSFGKNN